ncbi:MAG: hypothetical protein FWG37_06460, partial [Clostridia bacterium]|nr:hypothetical protein [Clostridia bacterium]
MRERHNAKALHEERKYGFFWYDWLWRALRPALVVTAACLFLGGAALTGWNALGEMFFWPV